MPKRRLDDEDFDLPMPSGPLGYTVKSRQNNSFSVHINTEIKSADHYSKVFDLMLDSTEGDEINLFIASPGGDLEGLSVLLEGIRLTDAHVRAIILASAHSAASILALNAHECVVTDSATMLCHEVRTGFGGKQSDLDSYTSHSRKISHKLLRDTYQGFLSPEELQNLLRGQEIWMDAEEIRDRLEKREDYYSNMLTSEVEVKADELVPPVDSGPLVQPPKPHKSKATKT